MQFKDFAMFAALRPGVAVSGPALAFDHGCDRKGRAAACHERVRLHDVYATRMRQVLARPRFTQVLRTPPVIGVRSERVEVAPAGHDTVPRPAVVEERAVRMLVTPARTEYIDQPVVRRMVRESVVVRPASVYWQRTRGFLGRGKRLCKIVVPAETRDIEREIVVSPARRVAQVTRALY